MLCVGWSVVSAVLIDVKKNSSKASGMMYTEAFALRVRWELMPSGGRYPGRGMRANIFKSTMRWQGRKPTTDSRAAILAVGFILQCDYMQLRGRKQPDGEQACAYPVADEDVRAVFLEPAAQVTFAQVGDVAWQQW